MAKRLEKGELGEKLKEWLGEHPKGVRGEFARDTGLEVSQTYFHTVRQKLLPRNATPGTLQEENRYLRWVCEGLERGFFARRKEELGEE